MTSCNAGNLSGGVVTMNETIENVTVRPATTDGHAIVQVTTETEKDTAAGGTDITVTVMMT